MGYYSEYLNKSFDFQSLVQERKNQIEKIEEIRGRPLLIYASDLNKRMAPISIDYSDLLLFRDQIPKIKSKKIDIILETQGGSGEVAEDIVNLIRKEFEEVTVIIPGTAKSAGTIIVMAADEILMEPASTLGPIDAQIIHQGKMFSADALLKGFEKIKSEVADTGNLNRAYIPILQGISPGELQAAENAKNFAIELVRKWLSEYKFKNWNKHSKTGGPVTEKEKIKRAEKIANELSDHNYWLTHGRSITIKDLEKMRLKIVDYSKNKNLHEALSRYYTLLQMTFHTNMYKLIETKESQIYRFVPNQFVPTPRRTNKKGQIATIDLKCHKCGQSIKIQANIEKKQPLQGDAIEFPKNNQLNCPNCQVTINLSDLRRQLESQTRQKVV